ncbi:hypothetical protein ACOSP7_032433 [Xanthoceras sorbifolium]|uniref:Transcription factor DIVARICATA-like n=1 Tax=Xanthoceras sorbifolium TaxID=99658 RepID=A0ABQ8H4G3_9ROSI|nr:hypothetical protein JRO89_XS14G0082100 [Xanthoceras sorbifolium]
METLYPASYMSNSNWFLEESQGSSWTREENKRFESALAVYGESTPDRWMKVAAMIPGKTVFDVIKQYRELEEDVSDIEAGKVPIPGYLGSSFTLELVSERDFDANRKKPLGSRSSDQERKKGVPWTEEEHRRFLLGLIKYGKGDWRNISRNYVVSKTPTQVASHAQKYFIRQLSGGKDKRRPSIHDITTVNLANTSSSDNRKASSFDQSKALPSQQKSASIPPKVSLEWNDSSDAAAAAAAAMVFGSNPGNLFIPSACEIGSNGLKLQGQNLYATAYHGAHFRPRNSVF